MLRLVFIFLSLCLIVCGCNNPIDNNIDNSTIPDKEQSTVESAPDASTSNVDNDISSTITIPPIDVLEGWKFIHEELDVYYEENLRTKSIGTVFVATIIPDWVAIDNENPSKESLYLIYNKDEYLIFGSIGSFCRVVDNDDPFSQISPTDSHTFMNIADKRVLKDIYLTPPKGDKLLYQYLYYFTVDDILIKLSFPMQELENSEMTAIHEQIISSMIITRGMASD